jgi:hypothetical protein
MVDKSSEIAAHSAKATVARHSRGISCVIVHFLGAYTLHQRQPEVRGVFSQLSRVLTNAYGGVRHRKTP